MKRPEILEDAGFDIYVDTQKLRDLDLPVEEMNVQDLIWCFNFPVWEKDGTDDWNLTPWEVIKNDAGTTGHRESIDKVDMTYPIVIIFNKDKWVVLDGIHRLVRAYESGNKTIKVKKLSKNNHYFKAALI